MNPLFGLCVDLPVALTNTVALAVLSRLIGTIRAGAVS